MVKNYVDWGKKKKKTPKTNKQTKTTKSQQSNRLLSAAKEWTTTVIRAQIKNNCANDKQMERQTNHTNSKLTPH